MFTKNNVKRKIYIGLLFIGILFLLGGIVFYSRIKLPDTSDLSSRLKTNVFVDTYPHATIENIWMSYQKKEIQKDGRTMDRSLNFLTTSEGQSYSLLRAVWMGDKEVFDRVLVWTKHNLQKREEDNLFAWKWGRLDDGSWGIFEEEGGLNTASDADQDIALALIFANTRWNQPHYLDEAQRLLDDIWDTEVVIINGRPYLTAGNWASLEEYPTLNPSYFSFAAYPIFAEVDPKHDWMALKDTSYEVLNSSTGILPPDWIGIDRVSGELVETLPSDKSMHFTDEAFRIPWRVGLDWLWHEDPRALVYLQKLDFLKDQWTERNVLIRGYTQDGQQLLVEENLSTYGALLPYFMYTDPQIARDIYEKKLISAYDPDTNDFRGDVGYYSKNWAWFGMAFYEGKLINIFSDGR